MSMPKKPAPLCASDTVLFMRSLTFVMDTAGELTSYGQSRRSPPAVMRTLWVSVFLWSDGADVVCVGDSASTGYLGFFDEFYCNRSFYFFVFGS